MFTASDQPGYSREECVEAAAEALAHVWERLDTTTAPAEARAV